MNNLISFKIILVIVAVFMSVSVYGDDAKKSAKMDIVETAIAAEGFGTLVTAVKAAGLVEALKSEGPFTVFAPTDEAFGKLPKGTVAALLEDKEKLTSILTYHVVSGKVMASDVVKIKSAETLNGQEVKVTVKDGNVMIDNALVTMTDIECSNGVIHVIDAVILPAEKESTVKVSESKSRDCGK